MKTESEALRYAQEKLFDILDQNEFARLYAYDRDAHEFSWKTRSRFIKRYYVGCGQEFYGNGDSWEEAVENLLVMAGVLLKRVTHS